MLGFAQRFLFIFCMFLPLRAFSAFSLAYISLSLLLFLASPLGREQRTGRRPFIPQTLSQSGKRSSYFMLVPRVSAGPRHLGLRLLPVASRCFLFLTFASFCPSRKKGRKEGRKEGRKKERRRKKTKRKKEQRVSEPRHLSQKTEEI